MVITTTTTKTLDTKKKSSGIPVTIPWKNARMVRNHSINVCVDEILNLSESLDVVKVNCVGNPSTGKTTLAQTIGHLVHKRSKIPFSVRMFYRKDLINFSDTIKTLEPINHVLIFDDVSFLKANLSGAKIHNIEKELSEIRHLEGGKDVKIILILNSHYTPAVSKYMRQSDFYIYTSLGTSDYDHLLKLTAGKFGHQIDEFRKMFFQSVNFKKFQCRLGRKGKFFTYPFRKPFAPVLWFNGHTLRIVVFPKREWIDQFCSICSNSEFRTNRKLIQTFEEVNKIALSKFGIGVIREGLRVEALINGIFTYRKRVKQCMSFFEKFMKDNDVNLEKLLEYYDLKEIKVRPKLSQYAVPSKEIISDQ